MAARLWMYLGLACVLAVMVSAMPQRPDGPPPGPPPSGCPPPGPPPPGPPPPGPPPSGPHPAPSGARPPGPPPGCGNSTTAKPTTTASSSG